MVIGGGGAERQERGSRGALRCVPDVFRLDVSNAQRACILGLSWKVLGSLYLARPESPPRGSNLPARPIYIFPWLLESNQILTVVRWRTSLIVDGHLHPNNGTPRSISVRDVLYLALSRVIDQRFSTVASVRVSRQCELLLGDILPLSITSYPYLPFLAWIQVLGLMLLQLWQMIIRLLRRR